jgi:LysM repeat protein
VDVKEVMNAEDAVSLIVTRKKSPEVYTVKDGDTIWDIAAAQKMSVNELQKANPQITDASSIQPGQVLNLPAQNQAPASPPFAQDSLSQGEVPDLFGFKNSSSVGYAKLSLNVKIEALGIFGTEFKKVGIVLLASHSIVPLVLGLPVLTIPSPTSISPMLLDSSIYRSIVL